ncbi:MAG: protein kinase [Acidobacteriia bacterium]|nr:protein kinase [Terriglobia bacterium]
MPQSANPELPPPPPKETRGQIERQDTLLLSDVPEATALLQEGSAPAAITAQLGSAVVAALAQRYDILAEAGSGSMGNVYKARDRETGETVALKLLKPEIASDQAMMERFKNELLFARKITHKNVCRVYEFNRLNGIAYTSMEFVEGESLRSVLNRFGGLPLRKGIDLVLQVCSGLKEAHAQGIVHRDLKPENVMIDGQGNVKIMDFGIARSMEALTRMTGSMVGTPAYMAPEQVAGKPVDYRTDIYSLGLIMYEVFTGKQAFAADNAVAVALKQLRESPPPPHELEPGIPVPVERAILKCLEKEPPKRFQSIGQLESALHASPAVPAIRSTLVSAPADQSVVVRPRPHMELLPGAPEKEKKRVSPVVWTLLGAFLVMGSLAGWHWAQRAKLFDGVAPPERVSAPKPPDFAFEVPARPADTDAAPSEDAPAPAENAAATPAEKSSPPASAGSPRETAPLKKQPAAVLKPAAPLVIRPRAARQTNETALAAPTLAVDDAPSYLRVGRFEFEERADSAAEKIKGLGLPAVVVPRRNLKGGRFWVILTGPLDPDRVQSTKEWLQTQGFEDVQQMKLPTAN